MGSLTPFLIRFLFSLRLPPYFLSVILLVALLTVLTLDNDTVTVVKHSAT